MDFPGIEESVGDNEDSAITLMVCGLQAGKEATFPLFMRAQMTKCRFKEKSCRRDCAVAVTC